MARKFTHEQAVTRHRRVVLLALRRRRVDRPVRHDLPDPVTHPTRRPPTPGDGPKDTHVRLLTARLSAKRRSRFAGPVVLLLALLVTGGVYAVLSPRLRPRTARPTSRRSRRAASCSSSGCASCHGKNGEGIVTKAARSTARRWSASAPPPSTSRSAPAGCRWRAPARRPPRKKVVYTEEEIAAARGVRRLPRPRPGDPDAESRPRPDPRGRARGGDRPRRRVLPHQLHGLPQLRRVRRRAARRQVRPDA